MSRDVGTSSGGISSRTSSWDEHYRRKGRTHEQFQYTLSDEYNDDYVPATATTPLTTTTAVGPRRSATSTNADDHQQLFPPTSDEPQLLASAVTYQPRPLPAWMMGTAPSTATATNSGNSNSPPRSSPPRNKPSRQQHGGSSDKYHRSLSRNTMFYPTAGLNNDDKHNGRGQPRASASAEVPLSLAASQVISVRECDADIVDGGGKALLRFYPSSEYHPSSTTAATGGGIGGGGGGGTLSSSSKPGGYYDPYNVPVTRSLTATKSNDLSSMPYQHQPYHSNSIGSTAVTATPTPTTAPQRTRVATSTDITNSTYGRTTATAKARTTTSASTSSMLSYINRSNRQQEYYDFVRENLIMFGDGGMNNATGGGGGGGDNATVSTGTGLSQEELLQRKRREDSWRRRKERRRQKHHKVQMPSSLLFANSSTPTAAPSRSRAPVLEGAGVTAAAVTNDRSSHTLTTVDTSGAVASPSHDEFGLPIFYNNGVGMDDYKQSRNSDLSKSPTAGVDNIETLNSQKDGGESKGVRFIVTPDSTDGTDGVTNKKDKSNKKGSRSSMVRRQRGDKSSSGRRWKIVRVEEEPDGINATVGSPGTMHSPKADPPIEDVRKDLFHFQSSERPKVPVDPPSSSEHRRALQRVAQTDSSDIVSEPSEVVTEIAPSPYLAKALNGFSGDSDNNSVLPDSRRPNPQKDDFDRYMESNSLRTLTSFNHDPGLSDPPRSSTRPTSANFTPRSEYSRYAVHDKKGAVLKPSPTSVLGFQSPGVRWSDNLTQQEYVTPESVKLYPYSADKTKSIGSTGQPKSILRSTATSSRSQNRSDDSESHLTSHTNDCPSDESPKKKTSTRTAAGYMPDANALSSESPSDIGFLDTTGRSVSPIPGESSMQVDEGDDLAGGSDNPASLSDSYLNFIEAVAAVVIQTKVRQYLAATLVKKLRWRYGKRMVPSSRTSQMSNNSISGNRHVGHRHIDSPVDFLTLAAVRIQAAFRGWWVRDCIAVDHYCATMIQKAYRGFLYRTRYLHLMYSIVTVQSLWRRQLARRKVHKRKFELVHYHMYDHAATVIQSKWRGFVCEMEYLRDYESILVVQSVSRGWIARRLISSWLRSHDSHKSRMKNYLIKKSIDPRIVHERRKMSHLSKPGTSTRNAAADRDISPSYLNHINFMSNMKPTVRGKNIPVYGSDESRSVQRQLFAMDAEISNKGGLLEHELSDLAPDDELADGEISALSSSQASLGRVESRPSGPNKWPTEFKAKAFHDEEKRRKEAQAAELAELNMRRRQMAIKAEARKRDQEVPVSASSTDRDDKNPLSLVMNPRKTTPHSFSEEKKETSSFDKSDEKKERDGADSPEDERGAVVSPESTDGSPETVKRKTGLSGAKKLLAKWQAWDKGGKPPALQVSMCEDTSDAVEISYTEESVMAVATGDIISSPFITPVKKKSDILETLDDAAKHVSPFSPLVANTAIDDTFDSAQQTGASCSIGSNARCESNAIYTANHTRVRVSGTNTAYHTDMLLQRSEAEQQRIDSMHDIFKRVGLMGRTKAPSPSRGDSDHDYY